MSIGRNITANLAARIWTFISLYIFSGVYIRIVGIESYGMISFYTLVFATISFVDAGISSSVNREFAKNSEFGLKLKVLYHLEKIYIPICIIAATVLFISSDYIALHWINNTHIALFHLSVQLKLIAIGVGLQLIPTIYFGALMGLQKQVWCNGVQIVTNLFKAAGGAALLYFVAPSLELYFAWQILCNLVYLGVLRYKIIHDLPCASQAILFKKIALPANLWKYITGMTAVSVLSAITMQADKIVISKVFSLEEFSYYSLASLIAQIPLLIATSIVVAVFPTLTKAYAENHVEEAEFKILTYTRLICAFIFPVAAVICFFNQSLFEFWISSKGSAIKNFTLLNNVTVFLSLGNTFLSLQVVPFYMLLAKGETKFTIYQGIVQVFLIIPGLYYCATHYGLNGIGVLWLVINFSGWIYLLIVTRSFVSKATFSSTITSVLKIGSTSFFVSFSIFLLQKGITSQHYRLLFAVLAGGVSLLLNLMIVSSGRLLNLFAIKHTVSN